MDACCGTGSVGVHALAGHGKNVVFFDSDKTQLEAVVNRLSALNSDYYIHFNKKLNLPDRFMLAHTEDVGFTEVEAVAKQIRYIPPAWLMDHKEPTLEVVMNYSNSFETIEELSSEYILFRKLWSENGHVRVLFLFFVACVSWHEKIKIYP